MHGAFDRMRHAVLASGSAACDVGEEALVIGFLFAG
jgi:hypothetical protein